MRFTRKIHLWLTLFLLLATSHLYAQTEAVDEGKRFYGTICFAQNLSGGDFQEMSDLSFTYRFLPSTGAKFRFSYANLFQKREEKQRMLLYTLSVSQIPVNMGRFRMIPSVGFGIANGKDTNSDNFTRLLFDFSVETQYFLYSAAACGVELRYLSGGRDFGSSKRDFPSSFWLGMKLTTFF